MKTKTTQRRRATAKAKANIRNRALLAAGALILSPAYADTMPTAKAPATPPPLEHSGLHVSLKGYRVIGEVPLAGKDLDAVVAPYLGRELKLPEYEQLIRAVLDVLHAQGQSDARVRVSRAAGDAASSELLIEGLRAQSTDFERSLHVAPTMHVERFQVTGAPMLSPEDAEAALAPWQNQDLTIDQLRQPAAAVANLLRARGYTLAQAYLPPQHVEADVVEIRVQPGVVEAVDISGAGKRLQPAVLGQLLADGASPGQPLRGPELERGLLTANDYPGVQVKARLVPGTEAGTTVVKADVTERGPVSGSVSVDNYGNRFTGEGRLSQVLNLDSLSGHGEQLSLSASETLHSTSGRLALTVPAGSHGTRVGASYARSRVNIDKEPIPVTLDGSAGDGSVFVSTPLYRSDTQYFVGTAAFNNRHLKHRVAGVEDSNRHINMGTLGVSGQGLADNGTQYTLGLSVSAGKLDLSDNPGDEARDALTARAGRAFAKANASFSLAHAIGEPAKGWSVFFSMSGQYANRNLDSAEKFQLGGPYGVRAYPVGEGYGDQGYLGDLELRHVFPVTRIGVPGLFVFFDAGEIQQYQSTWSNWTTSGQPNSYSLAGAGFGASLVKDDRASLKLTVSHTIDNNPNPTLAGTDSDGSTRDVRVYAVGSFNF